jgi:uncharacterized Zn-binding protein involved in type VI secretion
MSKPVARLGDPSNHGGVIISSASRTMANGILVARMGDLHVCPIPGHGVTPIVTGSNKTLVEGKPLARVGDSTGCGAVIVSGSPNTLNG